MSPFDPRVLHLVSTLWMTGLILFVQVVHYPLMASVGRDGFEAYERGHAARTGWVVGPLMIVELATAVWLALADPGTSGTAPAWVGLGLVILIWGSTALLQVPAHGRLSSGFDADVHRRLVGGNWVRTAAWVARTPIAVWMIL